MPSCGGRGEAKGGWNSDFVADLQANAFLVHCSSLRTVSPPSFADICDVTRSAGFPPPKCSLALLPRVS